MDDAEKAEQVIWENRRNAFLGGISDRIRSMSLGALVVIWGVFAGEHTAAALGVTKKSKIALLAIALSAVIVLALDLLEYSTGYQASRQRVGEKVKPEGFDYDGVRRRALLAKQILGLLTLIALILALGQILVGSLARAQTDDEEIARYYGYWCVGDRNTGESTIVSIGRKDGRHFATFNNRKDCSPPVLRQGYVAFACGEYSIAARRPNKTLTVSWWKDRWSSGNRETKILYDCRH